MQCHSVYAMWIYMHAVLQHGMRLEMYNQKIVNFDVSTQNMLLFFSTTAVLNTTSEDNALGIYSVITST